MFDQIEGMEQYGDVNTRHQILKAAVEHHNTINPGADIRMIDFDDLNEYLEKNPQEGRYRLLVCIQNHYLAVDVRQHQGVKSCLILDAGNDLRAYQVFQTFKGNGFYTLEASGMKGDDEIGKLSNIQTDSASCSMFALDHCVQLAAAPDDIYVELQNQAVLGVVPEVGDTFTWDCLPPNFVCNAQSFKLLERYNAENPGRWNEVMPNGMTMKDYVEQGTRLVLHKETGKLLKQNNSINVHVFQKAHTIYQNSLVSAEVPEQSPTLEDRSADVPEEQLSIEKTEVLKRMQKVIEDLEKSTVYGSKMTKNEKIQSLKDIKDTYSRGGAGAFDAPSLAQFQKVASTQRKFINFGGEARSGKAFKAAMNEIRENFQKKEAQAGIEKGPLKSGDQDKFNP